MIKKNLHRYIILSLAFFFLGWGTTGHQIINRYSTLSFPAELSFLLYWADLIAAHGSDADIRKSSDPNEGPKHYIDIDNYPEFISSQRITQNFDSLVMQHGYSFVLTQGILPWAIMETVDSIQAAFQRRDWQKAMLVSSDLGHYVGDAHMPLHITKNYNGQYTGQSGVHFRYESDMINSFRQQIVYDGDSVSFVPDVSEFVFEMLYANYDYVDSILQADLIAKNYAGENDNSTYYQKLWELTKNFTLRLFKNASYNTACLIYTAWKNAGEPIITNIEDEQALVKGFTLEQNYPNPFNSTTTIPLSLHEAGNVRLTLYNILGQEKRILLNEFKESGEYMINFNAGDLNSGVYIYKIEANELTQMRKMTLIK